MSILTSLLRRARQRRAYTDLLQMDDHILRDIGISRGELQQLSSGIRSAAPRRPRG